MPVLSAQGNTYSAATTMEEGLPKPAHIPLVGASLSFKDLSFTAALPGGESKTILEPCSGHLEAGQLVAIMGPSGCGKTTLLDMLAMKKSAPYEGQVFVNGHKRDAVLFQRIAAYVGQEDKMPGHWKVREALEFNACLKRQPGASRKMARARIDGLLDAFGLTEVANTYIGGAEVRGISGGQRRRVSLARGVAAQASLLFCDEPTSGLSATDAELCVKALLSIAKDMNVLVLVVIHQPRRELAEMFDTLMLLTSNPGRMAYFGPMQEAPAYFKECGYAVPEGMNATDYYLDLLTPGTRTDASSSLVKAFDATQRPAVSALVDLALKAQGCTAKEMLQAALDLDTSDTASTTSSSSSDSDDSTTRPMRKGGKARFRPYAVSFCEQSRVLLKRNVKLTLRNPGAVGMQLAMPMGMGVVLGGIFQGIGQHEFGIPQVEFVFILLTMLSLQSLPLMPLLIEQRGFMKYETSERLYTEAAHIMTSLCVTVPLSLLGAFCQTTIIFAISGLEWKYFGVLMFWTLLLFFMFDALFQCVSAIAPDAQQAQTMATPFLVLFMLFNGVVVTKPTAPVFLRWIFEISPTGYALQAIILRMAQDAGEGGQLIVDSLGYEKGQNTKGIVVILGMTVVLRLLQVASLKFLNKLQR